MNVVLWIVQIVLALAFLGAGALKLTQPRTRLAAQMSWVEDFGDVQVRGIGVLEVLAAVGLTLPALFGVATVLTPLAGVGLVLLMIGAAATHLRRSEPQMLVVNGALAALALLVAWGRFGPYHF